MQEKGNPKAINRQPKGNQKAIKGEPKGKPNEQGSCSLVIFGYEDMPDKSMCNAALLEAAVVVQTGNLNCSWKILAWSNEDITRSPKAPRLRGGSENKSRSFETVAFETFNELIMFPNAVFGCAFCVSWGDSSKVKTCGVVVDWQVASNKVWVLHLR
ncbi:hypothetical protein CAPTEDRAFT_196058 [Capitella teleta]|uniref:Uncharacterized protein n=1 Tax=Capitella teleta TaxID=283909 RepID=R7TU25_CAPTE|nr:hypothetical protein CAPTEDRAFT_196058 [Capitella teleta]|eukprot:ELT97179.1 hypothetical protein CAPTEDRAFT_196058 [Capitella teleta]